MFIYMNKVLFCSVLFCSAVEQESLFNSCGYFIFNRKADDKIFVCKFSKNVKSKLYHIENSKTRGQTV